MSAVQLLEQLLALEKALAARDVDTAAARTAEVAASLTARPLPETSAALREVFARCEVLATELHGALMVALKGSAVSSRAAHAYDREAGGSP